MSVPKKVSEIKIREAWCKGCGICVDVCPKAVLTMSNYKAIVVNLEACIACGRCEDACPDFCLEVVVEDNDPQE
ncbi:4Fe-4S binding protein [bacterium]|nr:4Fe-4S binding protein [bacterium]